MGAIKSARQRLLSGMSMLVMVSACATGVITPSTQNVPIAEGPSIEDITTPFTTALSCLSGKVPKSATFSVSTIADNTGKEQYADGGTGKLVTQGAGDMVQSALFDAGVRVVNRRDPNISIAESNWGLRSMADQIPSDFFISGSINSLDVIPGGGGSIEVAGVGPRYRQTRILVGLDLALTNAHDGQIVANASVQKQLFASELGFGADRFSGKTLVNIDIGALEREAMHYTLRQMLAFATFDLIAQVLDSSAADACAKNIPSGEHRLMDVKSYSGRNRSATESFAAMMAAAASSSAAKPGEPPPTTGQKDVSPAAARKLANDATTYAAQAIAAAQSSVQSVTYGQAAGMANNAISYMQLAVKALREAAAAGLTGIEGDTAATLVQQAVAASQEAQKRVVERPDAPAKPTEAAPAAPPPPVDPRDARAGGAGN